MIGAGRWVHRYEATLAHKEASHAPPVEIDVLAYHVARRTAAGRSGGHVWQGSETQLDLGGIYSRR
ncbi:MAG: hypothetical protein AUI36_14315 [Cyanobacteria bacterium 13_1_40CM_2_61_4]|nr:MAG: hypothetical protein AUI36_14315 [Cyanobacteria bacterium 13_1_40CM_2_61_4]